MSIPDVKYDVHVRNDDRWTVYTDAPTKGKALESARKLLSSGDFDAVKVTEDRGQRQEILVWSEQAAERAPKNLTIVPVEDAPYCTKISEVYEFEARRTLGRLLRQYLDHHCLTPTELLTAKSHMQALKRDENLCLKAMQNLSQVQTKGRDEKPHARQDWLEDALGKLVSRAGSAKVSREAEMAYMTKGLSGLVSSVEAEIPEKGRKLALLTFMGAQLSTRPDWEDKLELLLDQADKNPPPEGLALIDELTAEIFDGNAAVHDILGYQKDLATALVTLVQVCAGRFKLEEASNTPLERLSGLMESPGLPSTQNVLLERVTDALAGTAALTKGERPEEQAGLTELLRHLMGHKLLANSGALSEAATLRAKSVLREEYEDESTEKAIDNMVFLLPTIAAKLSYLMDLSGTDYGHTAQDHVVACLANVLAGVTSVRQLVDGGSSGKELVMAAAGIRDRLMKTDLPEDWRQRFAKKIYDLLVVHAEGGKTAPANLAARPVAEANDDKPAKTDDSLNRRELSAGEFLFHEGDDGDEAYLVLEGLVNIIKKAGDEEVVIAQVGNGAIIGEMALIDSEPRMASARAAADTVLSVIPSKDMKARFDKLEKFDPVMRRLMGMFVQRMRESRFISVDS